MQGSEFGLAAMAEVVAERPETIFIGTANQVAKGVEHVWRYKLTFAGAERMYVRMEPPSTTHAKRAAVFRTSASFWEIGVHEWETNDVPSRAPTQKR